MAVRKSTTVDLGKCCRTTSMWGKELLAIRFLTRATPENRQTREIAPGRADREAHNVSSVGNPHVHKERQQWSHAKDQPDDHHDHRLWMNINSGARIKFSFHPRVAQQA